MIAVALGGYAVLLAMFIISLLAFNEREKRLTAEWQAIVRAAATADRTIPELLAATRPAKPKVEDPDKPQPRQFEGL